MAYDVGDTAVLEATFTDAITGALTTPTTCEVVVIDPEGVEWRTFDVETVSTGLMRATFPLTMRGIWKYGFVGTGAASGVEWRTLAVRGE